MSDHTDEHAEHLALLGDVREGLKHGFYKNTLWHILKSCNIYSVATGEFGTLLTGKRAVGLEILDLLEEADQTAYARLLLEKQKAKQGRDNEEDT